MATYSSTIPTTEAAEEKGEEGIKYIAISLSKPARVYFNIARRAFENTDCVQFSALETAIVLAVDATFHLTRARMATIESIQTSQVEISDQLGRGGSGSSLSSTSSTPTMQRRPVKRARIQILLRKTEEFSHYLETTLPAATGAAAGEKEGKGEEKKQGEEKKEARQGAK